MRNQKGITLVALVVTIVVLLILAGTSIAMLTGDTGIFTNAQKAKAANTEGEVIERMDIAYNSIKAAKIIDSNVDGATAKTLDALVTSVKNDLGMDATKDTDKGYTITTRPAKHVI